MFDFLGYMWLPIVANFINIILIIFGSFGAVQYITNYLLAVSIFFLYAMREVGTLVPTFLYCTLSSVYLHTFNQSSLFINIFD